MRVLVLAFLSSACLYSGCTGDRPETTYAPSNHEPARSSTSIQKKQFPIAYRSKYATVSLKEYVLISDDLERDRAEAQAVVQAKMELPRAMQTKDRKDFENILARNFVFRSEDEFFDRSGYINNRVEDPSKVKQADYRNMAVQFITPERALVTYSNLVEDQPGGPGAWKADMTWADIIVKEDGQWKYETVHQVLFKDLTTLKQK